MVHRCSVEQLFPMPEAGFRAQSAQKNGICYVLSMLGIPIRDGKLLGILTCCWVERRYFYKNHWHPTAEKLILRSRSSIFMDTHLHDQIEPMLLNRNDLKYPSVDVFILLQQEMRKQDIDVFIVQPANLDYIAYRLPYIFENVQDRKKRLFLKAAELLRYLAADAHAFNNGNKRMAFISTSVFLSLNGMEITVPIKDARESIMLDVASGKLKDINKIAQWLEDHSEHLDVMSYPSNFSSRRNTNRS